MDQPPELCQILYSEDYKATMARLREHLEKKIYTEDALKLTEQVLELLASHYTTWQYRYTIIRHLNKNLFDELDWCELVALDNEKNYQIWNYRQRIIEDIMREPATAAQFEYRREFPILRMMLQQDLKNHHVWLYRKWFVERFDLYDDHDELDFVAGAIDDDLRNNSAWTHRYFLKAHSKAGFGGETAYCQAKIDICPQNASSWNYLAGIYKKTGESLRGLKQFCLKYGNVANDKIASSYAVEMLASIAVEEHDVAGARELYRLLAEKYDPIRASYWRYLEGKLE